MPWSDQGGGDGGWKGGGQGPWGQGPSGGGPKPPDLEDLLRQGQERLKRFSPGGGSFGSKGIVLGLLILVLLWLATGIYRVNTDEQGVVTRFGAFKKLTAMGLNYHLPYPFEAVTILKVTRVNRVSVGVRSSGEFAGPRVAERDVPEESLILTGDENIVDLDFTVLWQIKDASAFLFNVYDPTMTVKMVAESSMREIVGRNDIQPILSEKKADIEVAVKALIQKTLDEYGAGILITNLQLQKVDPPAQVVEAYRDVQAAEADKQAAINQAQEYANKVVPEARGNAARIRQASEGYKARVVAEAVGQSSRYEAIFKQYKKAPEVTRKRMFLETMESVFGNMNKVLIDEKAGGGSGVVPYLPLGELTKGGKTAAGRTQ
ncbi:MAG: FtsH protease activity modulator HflK [Hyphomicrobiales bacterium]|nr:MAG: FtsH protease activity modulator HflK [Hyphomicrobiales bacterium]